VGGSGCGGVRGGGPGVVVYPPRALSWAQAASEAASRGTMLRLEAKLSLKSSRHVTRSMEGQDRMQRSDSRSLGPGDT